MTGLDDAGFADATDRLVAADPMLTEIVDRWGRPRFWTRPASFATLVLLVLEQQVSLASGKAVFDRIRGRLGDVTPSTIAAAGAAELHALGTTRQKASYVTGLAEGILAGTIDWSAVVDGERDACRAALLAIRGIGPWTADVWLLACRGFADEWPIGDRALQVGVGDLQSMAPVVGDALVEAGAAWRPYRSTAARLIWHDYLCRRGRAETVVDGLERVVPAQGSAQR